MIRTLLDIAASASNDATPIVRIGCAGWSIPSAYATRFPGGGTHLQRYACVFNAVEINSSFYRPHRARTYRSWAESVPPTFRFSVKMPKVISHEKRLEGCDRELIEFLDQAICLGEKLGCLLIQLPPSLAFDPAIVSPFLHRLRQSHLGPIACEPRNTTWFSTTSEDILRNFGISRVAADPACTPRAALPGGDYFTEYTRMHGSPKIYYDAYSSTTIASIRQRMNRAITPSSERWCIFDNTALGHATGDALALSDAC